MASRRDLIRMSDDEVTAFLSERHTMNIASFGPDGNVHLVAMWYGFLEGDTVFETYGKSQKVLNLNRDPRITVLVEEGDAYDELRGVELVGTALERERIGAVGTAERTAVRQLGEQAERARGFWRRCRVQASLFPPSSCPALCRTSTSLLP